VGGVERRLRRLEAETPVVRTEEEIRAEACRRRSTEDLTVLEETMRRLEEMDAPELGWEGLLGELPEEERDAFEQAYARYEEATREARDGQ
jgi:hypothetical protein